MTNITMKKQGESTDEQWKNIYASRQDQNVILHGMVCMIEDHEMPFRQKEDKKVSCAVIMLGSIKGIVPITETPCENKGKLRKLIGQFVPFKVMSMNKEANLFGASITQALELMSKKTWAKIKEGQIRTVIVRDINPSFATVELDGISGKLDINDISHGWVNDVRDHVSIGDQIEVFVKTAKAEEKILEVSLKELKPNPWPGVMKRYQIGAEVYGEVSGIPDYGIFVNLLEPGVSVLCKQKEENFRPGIGEKVIVKITEMNPEKEEIRGRVIRRLGVR